MLESPDEGENTPLQEASSWVEKKIFQGQLKNFVAPCNQQLALEDRNVCFELCNWSHFASWWNGTLVKENEKNSLPRKHAIFKSAAALLKEHFKGLK